MLVKEWFSKKYNCSIGQIDNMLTLIGYVESKNVVDSVQKSNIYDKDGNKIKGKFKDGPGRGLFQFETKEGSGAFQTALNRIERLYNKILFNEVPYWIKESKSHDNASLLDKKEQEDLLLADLSMKKVKNISGFGDMLIKDSFKKNDFKELWLEAHWAGAEKGTEDYIKKSEQWDKEMLTFYS
tara:strand:+ start:253 stop:801 length:549 start_codon:yes stop_codon:yes gene_type:complete